MRLLPGLDIVNFLKGSKVAYACVSHLINRGETEALEPLVSPGFLEAMEQSQMCGGNIMGFDEPRYLTARLSRAQLIDQDEQWPAGSCHLDVRFVSLQRHTLVDVTPGAAFALEERLQESTWRFEGVVCEDAASDEDERGWRVNEIDWQVWEVGRAEEPQT